MSSVFVAMIYATIAASFVIEQNGTPELRQTKVFTEIFEEWNGESYKNKNNNNIFLYFSNKINYNPATDN